MTGTLSCDLCDATIHNAICTDDRCPCRVGPFLCRYCRELPGERARANAQKEARNLVALKLKEL